MNGIKDSQKNQSSAQSVKALTGINQEELKQCNPDTGCGKVKPVSEFYVQKDYGHRKTFSYLCKECRKLDQRKRNKTEEYRTRNRERQSKSEYKKWQTNYNTKVRYSTPEKKQKKIDYEKSEHCRKLRRARERKRLKTDKKFRLNQIMGRAILDSLKRNKTGKAGRRWVDLVGYDHKQLEKHLRKTLKKLDGYTWKDFMNGKLHVDHILPKSKFNYDSPDHPEFKRCWCLKNLRLLPASDNHKKSNKCENFQTAF